MTEKSGNTSRLRTGVTLEQMLEEMDTGRPLYVDRVAVDFPELRIVAGHIGWPWTEEMIAIAQKHPNVWIDTSAHVAKHFPPPFVHFLKTFGKDKCIWASDWPILDFE